MPSNSINQRVESTRNYESSDGVSTVQTTFELENVSLPDESHESTMCTANPDRNSSAVTDGQDQQTAYQVSETMRYVPQIDNESESSYWTQLVHPPSEVNANARSQLEAGRPRGRQVLQIRHQHRDDRWSARERAQDRN